METVLLPPLSCQFFDIIKMKSFDSRGILLLHVGPGASLANGKKM